MKKNPSEHAPTEAEFLNICNEHRLLRVLIGKLECSRTALERQGLLSRLDDSFAFHRIRELPASRRPYLDEIIEAGRGGHYSIDDLVYRLSLENISLDSFRAIAAVIREEVTAYIAEEECYLRSRMSRSLHRRAVPSTFLDAPPKADWTATSFGTHGFGLTLVLPQRTSMTPSVEAD